MKSAWFRVKPSKVRDTNRRNLGNASNFLSIPYFFQSFLSQIYPSESILPWYQQDVHNDIFQDEKEYRRRHRKKKALRVRIGEGAERPVEAKAEPRRYRKAGAKAKKRRQKRRGKEIRREQWRKEREAARLNQTPTVCMASLIHWNDSNYLSWWAFFSNSKQTIQLTVCSYLVGLSLKANFQTIANTGLTWMTDAIFQACQDASWLSIHSNPPSSLSPLSIPTLALNQAGLAASATPTALQSCLPPWPRLLDLSSSWLIGHGDPAFHREKAEGFGRLETFERLEAEHEVFALLREQEDRSGWLQLTWHQTAGYISIPPIEIRALAGLSYARMLTYLQEMPLPPLFCTHIKLTHLASHALSPGHLLLGPWHISKPVGPTFVGIPHLAAQSVFLLGAYSITTRVTMSVNNPLNMNLLKHSPSSVHLSIHQFYQPWSFVEDVKYTLHYFFFRLDTAMPGFLP